MKPSEFWGDNRTEREFEESGLQCCTRTNDMGHRCGYVALPKGHPLFGKDWDKCYDIAPELDVDGGITFANGTGDTWILGWDAAHAWHRRDWSIVSDGLRKSAEEQSELYVDFGWPGGSYLVDADMAEGETRRFARQLAKLAGRRTMANGTASETNGVLPEITRARGTLTAEQVREAVMSADRWEKPMGDTGLTNTHLIIRDDGWQAIADELNAELGSGTCENLAYYSLINFECSVCGCKVYGGDELGANIENGRWNNCPNCGRAVKR